MHVTTELVEKLKEYKNLGGRTNVEVAKMVKMTPQNLGRILSGQIRVVNDTSGALMLQLLGLDGNAVATASVGNTKINVIQATYVGHDMEPTLQNGDILFCLRVPLQAVEDGDIVVASFKSDDGKKKVACRYASPMGARLLLSPEIENGASYNPLCTNIEWIGRVLSPRSRIQVPD